MERGLRLVGSGPQWSGVCENCPQEPSRSTTPSHGWGCRGPPQLVRNRADHTDSSETLAASGSLGVLGKHLPCMQLHLSLVPCAQGWGDRGDRQRGHGEGRAHSRALPSGRVPSRLWQTRACGSRRPEGLRGVCAPALLPHLPGAGRGWHTPVKGQVTAGREVRPGPGQHPCGPCHSLGLHDSPTSFLGRRGRKKVLG